MPKHSIFLDTKYLLFYQVLYLKHWNLKGAKDKLLQIAGKSDFSFSTAWSVAATPSPIVDWYNIVWCSRNVPKVSCRLYRTICDRLKTRDRLLQFGIDVDPICGLRKESESRDLLFFKYLCLAFIWNSFRLKLQFAQGDSVGVLEEILTRQQRMLS